MILHSLSTLFHYNTQILEFCGTGVIMIVMNYLLFYSPLVILFFVFLLLLFLEWVVVGVGRVFKIFSASNLCTEGTGLFNPGGRRINII